MTWTATHRPNRIMVVCLALALFLAAVPANARTDGTPLRIDLAETARVDGDQILLGQIARLHGGDAALIERLNSLDVGRSPMPGHSRRVDTRHLKLRLKRQGLAAGSVRFTGVNTVTVTRQALRIARERIEAVVGDWVWAHQPWPREQVRIRRIQTVGEVTLPAGAVTYRIDAPERPDFLKALPVVIHFKVDGRDAKRVWASVTLEVIAPVVVSRTPLARYQTIDETDIQVRMMDMAALSGPVITDPAAVVGKRMRRNIAANTALRTDLVEFPPLVRRGDVVTIVAESDGLRITARGEVRKKGRQGERIGVVNLDSGKTIYARVLDPRTVRVDF
jgi:flagellar basal body P-ring formation protein FlgA